MEMSLILAEKRKTQAIATKKNIFEAARTIIMDSGYGALTIREVSRRAGTSPGNFYNYFQSKEQILNYFYELTMDEYDQRFDTTHDADPIVAFTNFYTWYADYLTKMGVEFCRAFFSTSNQSLNIDKYYNQILNKTLKYATQLCAQNSSIKTAPRRINDDVCIIFKGAILDWCVSDGAFDLATMGTRLVRTYLKGL